MRGLICVPLVIRAWGQIVQAPPTVRDAYVVTGKADVASLTDHLIVVVCKGEYDVWRKDPKSAPVLSLYMNGLLMKGPEAVRPMPAVDNVKDPQREAVKKACRDQANAVAGSEELAAKNDAQFKPEVKQLEDPSTTVL